MLVDTIKPELRDAVRRHLEVTGAPSFTVETANHGTWADTETVYRHERSAYDACPLCDSKGFHEDRTADCSRHPLYRPEFSPQMRWMLCGDCGHSFTDGYYDGAALEALLGSVQATQEPGADFERKRHVAAEIVERVVSCGFTDSGSACYRNTGKRAWLDVGCGDCSLIMTASEFGFAAVGIDKRQHDWKLMSALGVTVSQCELCDCSGSYDVISMADVIEHVSHPNQLLTDAHKKLVSDGLLFLSCPAYNSPAWRTLGDQNPYWGEIEHFHNFSCERLYDLLRETGFEPVSYSVSKRYRVGMEVIARRVAN